MRSRSRRLHLGHEGRILEGQPAEVAWDALGADFAELSPPSGDRRAVARLLKELRAYGEVLRLLLSAEDESALGALAGLAVQAELVEEALEEYGLDGCAGITGLRSPR